MRGGGRGDGLAGAVLDERVAAGEDHVGRVRREGEGEPLEVAATAGRAGPAARARRASRVRPARPARSSSARTRRRALARSSRSVLVQRPALPGHVLPGRPREARERARPVDHGAAAVAVEAPRRAHELGPGARAVDAGRGLGGVGRGRAAHGGDVVEQRAVGVVADRGDDRYGQERDGAAEGLVAEREEVGERAAAAGDHDHVRTGEGDEVLQRAADARRRVAVLHRREGPHEPPAPALATQAGEDVVASLASLAGDDADRTWRAGEREGLLRGEEPLGVEPLAQPVDLGQQVALARHAERGDGEREGRGRRAAARVEVRAARHHDLGAVGQGAERGHQLPQSSRHMEQGRAPAPSRSSNHAFVRLRRRSHSSPKSCTRAKPRSCCRSRAA